MREDVGDKLEEHGMHTVGEKIKPEPKSFGKALHDKTDDVRVKFSQNLQSWDANLF